MKTGKGWFFKSYHCKWQDQAIKVAGADTA